MVFVSCVADLWPREELLEESWRLSESEEASEIMVEAETTLPEQGVIFSNSYTFPFVEGGTGSCCFVSSDKDLKAKG